MADWLNRLRDVVWPAVLAVVFLLASLVTVFLDPESLSKGITLGLAGVTMALLAIRE